MTKIKTIKSWPKRKKKQINIIAKYLFFLKKYFLGLYKICCITFKLLRLTQQHSRKHQSKKWLIIFISSLCDVKHLDIFKTSGQWKKKKTSPFITLFWLHRHSRPRYLLAKYAPIKRNTQEIEWWLFSLFSPIQDF